MKKIFSIIFSSAALLLLWIAEKILNMLIRIFEVLPRLSRANLSVQKKVAIAVALVALGVTYLFNKYHFFLIPRNEDKQSLAQKDLLASYGNENMPRVFEDGLDARMDGNGEDGKNDGISQYSDPEKALSDPKKTGLGGAANISKDAGGNVLPGERMQRKSILRGEVLFADSQKVTIKTKEEKEETFEINDRTRIMPPDSKIEKGLLVTVFIFNQNGKSIADRISIMKTKSGS